MCPFKTCHTLWLWDQSTTSLLQIGLCVAINDHHCQQVDVYIVRCSPTSPCLSARYQSGLVVPLVAHSVVYKLLQDIFVWIFRWAVWRQINFQFLILSTSWALKLSRVAEVAREHGWHPPKSLDSDENFKPEHTLFCRELRFVAN